MQRKRLRLNGNRALDSEFQTVGPVEAKECCSGHVEQSVDGGWRITGAGDRQHQTLEHSSR